MRRLLPRAGSVLCVYRALPERDVWPRGYALCVVYPYGIDSGPAGGDVGPSVFLRLLRPARYTHTALVCRSSVSSLTTAGLGLLFAFPLAALSEHRPPPVPASCRKPNIAGIDLRPWGSRSHPLRWTRRLGGVSPAAPRPPGAHRQHGAAQIITPPENLGGRPVCLRSRLDAVANYVHLGNRWFNLVAIVAAFGVVYAGITIAAGIPEDPHLLRRRRS